MKYSKEQILRLADSLEICADPQRGCGECMFDKTCDRGEENGGAILKEAAKVIRAFVSDRDYLLNLMGQVQVARAATAGDAPPIPQWEDAGKGQAWQMDLYERAIEKFGEKKQVTKAVEELGELIVELSRWLNAERPADEHLLSHIREDLADVCVMTDQLQLIFGDVSDWEMYKLERLERKLVKGL